ncbi:MAG: amine dehydrogenase [Proteobacteria bacterium]|nr:amine dehydrogenase [Pseudomonadota bacterium]
MRKYWPGVTLGMLAASIAPSWGAAPAKPQPPPLAAEHLTISTVGPKSPHWVYVVDYAFNNEIDSRVWLFDGDTHRRIGQIDAGFFPAVNISPDGHTTAVATTYFARGGHGTRTDVVEFNDNNTLGKTGEIVIPPKHAQTLSMLFTMGYSSDGKFVYVPYLTPAASFGVLDPAKKTVLSEIDTAGCTLVFPWGPNQVSSICESGRLLTVTLNAQGKEASRTSSEQFFNVDEDPVFAQAVPLSDGYAYLSFLGQVHEIDFTQKRPAARAAWSLVSAAEKGTWRPGGVQIGAVHRGLNKLFVPMHKGGDGSHKDPGTEIWVFDLKSHQRTARWPIDTRVTGGAVAVQVSQDPAPLLFVATDKSHVLILDAQTGKLRHDEKNLGQTPQLMLNP